MRHGGGRSPFDLNRFELPAADAMVYLAAHPGEGHYLLHAIDPSVARSKATRLLRPGLDMYDPANGFVRNPRNESRYSRGRS